MHKKTKGNLLITLGILLIAAAIGLAGYNLWDAGRAQKAAEEITGQLISEIESKVEDGKTAAPYMDPNTPMPVEMIDGYEYIGVLEIPSEGLSLPVMKEWDYTRLKISPCRFTGSYYSDDLVICAHNYMRHLGPLLQIGIGEDIYFTNVDGLSIRYIVTNRETVEPTAVEQMIEKLLMQNSAADNTRIALRIVQNSAAVNTEKNHASLYAFCAKRHYFAPN